MTYAPQTVEQMIHQICDFNGISQIKLVEFKVQYPIDEDQSTTGHIRYINALPSDLEDITHKYEDEREELRSLENPKSLIFSHEESPSEYLLGITSNVVLGNGASKHMLFLDFHCEISDKNFMKVKRLLDIYDLRPGFIVQSGRSYHFYSAKLYETDEWIKLFEEIDWPDKDMGDEIWENDEIWEKIELRHIVDHIWLDNQVSNRYATLRLSKNPLNKKVRPKVLDVVGYST